jgi:predicted N-acyltransferase
MDARSQIELRVVSEISEIPQESWDSLLDSDDNPFVSWRFLEALEHSGSAAPERGWWPCHLTAWQADELVGAAPAYVKADSVGDFSRDWGFAEAAQRNGLSYYPKLVIGVPFSPVTGRRALVREGWERKEMVNALIVLALELARESNLSSIHVLYHLEEECEAFESAGLTPRLMIQYHWHNRDYADLPAWVRDLKSKKRTQIRRECREPAKQGISIHTVRGEQLRADPERWAQTAHELYVRNTQKHFWGGAYLTRDFFDRAFDRLDDHVELVIAERDHRVVAGAFNLATESHLFGRYWGCHEEHRFLHFNVCLYHSIAECIERGVQVFEGGAGGEHKLSRGFEPAFVYTSHRFLHQGFHDAVSRYLHEESDERRRELTMWEQSR